MIAFFSKSSRSMFPLNVIEDIPSYIVAKDFSLNEGRAVVFDSEKRSLDLLLIS